MAYIPTEDIKKKIVDYLEKSIESETFDFRNLCLISINKNIKDAHIKKIEKAIDSLIDEGEIQKYKSNLEIYVPTALEKHKNLMALKLGDPFRTIIYTYIYGLFAIILLITFISDFRAFIFSSFDFSKPINVIGNSVALGTLFPFGVGYILSVIFNAIRKPLSSKGVNRGALATIIFFPSIFFLIYIASASYLQTSIEPYLIIASMGLGLTFGYYFYKMVLKKPSEDIKLNNRNSD